MQNTLLVGGLVLLLLLAGITNLVTRQVVRPVRQAAAAAEQFAGGDLDQRLAVLGEDDLAKLAVSYNGMAESIQGQIRQLEEFGGLQRRFTSDVSHELRTPLTTVRMAADVLHASREQFPAGLARSTELLVDELDRFESLLGDLLEISRLDAGVEELSAEFIDVRPIATRAVEQVRVIAGNAGSSVELVLPDEEVIAEVDARRVERILRNLLGNAVDHSEGKPVVLTVAANETAVAVTVRDHGVGLRPARPTWCSTGSGAPTRRATGAPAAPGSAWRSARRTRACTAAGSTRGASPARAPASGSCCRAARTCRPATRRSCCRRPTTPPPRCPSG